ncbi:NAD-dependent epimerase/dehydratase family protein [Luteimicrobium sp. DT211]|uniref:NAD-dependent epimerase/dehydratase family protein n=1 Tax=Luteimicrobium sp. DT211 TaxID=3393412 RepID=UPI003CEB689F
MRIAITGASGNVGTAVLRALVEEPVVTSIVGIASRVPRADGSSTVAFPHDHADWVRVDLGDDSDASRDRLRSALNGADVVVHLAWATAPSHDADRLDAVNVDGTRRVLDAAAAGGAQHVVVASSAGVYAPAPDPLPRDEEWARTGIRGSLHSIQKLAVERELDRFERAHPAVTVTRVRTPLVLHPDAATELGHLYLGRLVPPRLLRRDHPPVLPWVQGMRLQAVHADDVAAGYRTIIAGRHPGAFNLAAPQVLDGRAVAEATGTPSVREVSPRAARAALALAWRAHATPLSPDWLDLALGIPVLDAGRAASALRWTPRYGTAETLREVSTAVGRGRGFPSPPLVGRKV